MRVHHLNCGSMLGGTIVTHCLLVEADIGLVLVDTGFGSADVDDPGRTLGMSRHALMPRLDLTETAAAQIRRLGFDPRDVRDIVMTHLDYDHAGGLSDFPWARVHVHRREYDAALNPGPIDRVRYRQEQFAHRPHWTVSDAGRGGDRWFGFGGVRELPGLDGIAMVPLHGHTTGHVGIAVDLGSRWLLHAGDAYLSDMHLHRKLPPALLGGIGFGALDPRTAASSVVTTGRLADLAWRHSDEVTIFCSHDARAFARLAADDPAAAKQTHIRK